MKASKLFEIIVSLVAMFTAPFIIFANTGFYTYLQQLSGLFCVPVFTIILFGFLTKKVSPQAAKSGVIFFIITYILSNYVFEINLHYLHLLGILFLLTSVCMFVVSKFYPNYSYTPFLIKDQYSTPWKNRHWAAAILIGCMIFIFLFFSKMGIA